MSEIKTCPFCGGEAERLDIEDGENAGGSCVCCKQCFASGHVEFGRKENFVSRWNARPIEDELAASRDRASDACASVQRERDALRGMLGEAIGYLHDIYGEELCGDKTNAPSVKPRLYTTYIDWTTRYHVRAFLSRYEGEVK